MLTGREEAKGDKGDVEDEVDTGRSVVTCN